METRGRTEGLGPGGDKAMILVVEDEPQLRRILLEILSRAGFRCVGAADAESALELATKADASAAVVDLVLPGMSGAELAWRLRKRLPEFPIVGVSGYLHLWDADDLKDLGIFKALPKPFDPGNLVRAVTDALSRPSQEPGLRGRNPQEGE